MTSTEKFSGGGGKQTDGEEMGGRGDTDRYRGRVVRQSWSRTTSFLASCSGRLLWKEQEDCRGTAMPPRAFTFESRAILSLVIVSLSYSSKNNIAGV